MRNLLYFLKEAFIGFKRHFSTAFGSIVTIFLSLFIIGMFLVAGLILNKVVEAVESEVGMSIWLADDASEEDIAELTDYVLGLDGVADVMYISKAQGLEIYKEQYADSQEIITMLDEMAAEGINDIPASLEVTLSDPQSVERIAFDIQANTTFQRICEEPANPEASIRYGQKTVDKLFTVTKYIR